MEAQLESVLISINPKWCQLISIGKKTFELRKNKPKLEVPFKCYVYCTKPRNKKDILEIHSGGKIKKANGKVIGEFVCDKIVPVSVWYLDPNAPIANKEFPFFCLTDKEIMDYLGNGVQGWGWHISNFVLYDEPKELSDFWNNEKCPYNSDSGCTYKYHCYRSGGTKRCGSKLLRPPQSWCYVKGA